MFVQKISACLNLLEVQRDDEIYMLNGICLGSSGFRRVPEPDLVEPLP